jgi:hypothetical protein
MASKSNQVMLESVEKLIQIGHMVGNVNVRGNVERIVFSVGEDLRSALRDSAKPEEGITDLIVKTADKFSQDELLDFDTGVEIIFLLMVHPNPTLALNILSSRRPKADMITLIWLLPAFAKFEEKAKTLRVFGFDEDKRIQEITNAFKATKGIKDWQAEDVPKEVVSKLVDEFLQAYTKDGVSEWAYFVTHPEVVLLSVDSFIASMALQAFMHSDHKALGHFMKIRQTFSNHRPGG